MRGQGMPGTAAPGPFVQAGGQPTSPMASPPPPPHGQPFKSPPGPAELLPPWLGHGCSQRRDRLGDAEDAQPLLFQTFTISPAPCSLLYDYGGGVLCHPLPILPPTLAHRKNLLATQTPAYF